MSAVTDDLRMLPQRAADWIDTHGWVQGTERNAAGAVCLCGCGEAVGHGNRFRSGHNTRGTTNLNRYEVKTDGCWIWTGPLNRKGYGHAQVDGTKHTAHRAVYVAQRGAVLEGMHVDHLCHVTSCVNPDHMEIVTAQVNNQRKRAAKLTKQDAADIRASFEPNHVLMRRYGLSRSYIDDVRAGRKMCPVHPDDTPVSA
jgi:hypothetical protein